MPFPSSYVNSPHKLIKVGFNPIFPAQLSL
jgi:hypothetical protein